MNHTCLATTNYWAPLNEETEEEEQPEQINTMHQSIANTNGNKWMCRIKRRRAISNRFWSNITLCTGRNGFTKKGKSNKEVYLPDNTKLYVTH
jgi:hypothetical protein